MSLAIVLIAIGLIVLSVTFAAWRYLRVPKKAVEVIDAGGYLGAINMQFAGTVGTSRGCTCCEECDDCEPDCDCECHAECPQHGIPDAPYNVIQETRVLPKEAVDIDFELMAMRARMPHLFDPLWCAKQIGESHEWANRMRAEAREWKEGCLSSLPT